MMVGNLFIYGALVASLGSTAVLVWAAFRDESVADYGRYLLFVAAGLFTVAYGYLVYQFVTTDYTNKYVWDYTADYLNVVYRISGTYAGVNGSLLLWATLVGIISAWLLRRSVTDEDTLVVGSIAAGVTTVFAFMAVAQTPFQPIHFEAGRQVFGPSGLNPLLINPYMGIHPPITFAGYALTVIPFAIGVAHFVQVFRGKPGMFERWLPRTMDWLRLSWIMLTGAVALGALWSYNTLGWGGLWAWDPVETGVLVSWFVVTASVHAVANYRRRGQNALLAPSLTAITFPGVIFARLITQSGTSPLHSFGVNLSETLLVLLVVSFLASVVPALYLWLRTDDAGRDLDENLLTLGNLLYLSVLVIGVLTFISFWGIAIPMTAKAMGTELSIGTDFFNLWSYPVAVAMLLLLGLYNDYVANGRRCLRMFWAVVAATLVAAIVPLEGWKIAPEASGVAMSILGNANILVLFPPVGYVLLGVSDRLMTVMPQLSSRDEKLALTGRGLVHVAIALIILASPFTYMFATSAAGMVPVGQSMSGGHSLGDSPYTIQAEGFNSNLQPTVSTFDDREREGLTRAVQDLVVPLDSISSSAGSTVVVTGSITDVRQNSETVSAQLDEAPVWVPIGSVQDPEQLVGMTVWAQGTVEESDGEASIETSSLFVGQEPIDVIVPDNRMVRRTAQVSVYKGGEQIARGQMGHRDHLGYGSVSEVYIKKGLLVDTYVSPQQFRSEGGTSAFYVTVKEIPLMNLVRLGIALLLLGGLLIFRYDPGTKDDWPED